MATVVQLKRSETTGVIPTANDIAVGELAVNLADGALYTKRTDGAIIEIGVSEQVPVFFADEVDLGDLTSAGETYDMGGLDGGSPASSGIQLTDISVTDSGGDGSLAYNSSTGVITYTGPSATDVRAHFSASTGINITDGAISTSITQYTDALARGAVSVTDSGGDGSLSYDNTTGVFTYTGPAAADYQAAISVTDSGGDGSLSYDNTTGVFTYTGPSATDVRAHFSAGTGITLTSGAIAADTSVIATKQYVDEVAQGLLAKPAVEIATTANLTSTYNNGTGGVGATLTATSNGAFPEIDGITLTSTTLGENGVLVKNQTSAAQNGRYNLTQVGDGSNPWVLTRCGLCDEADEIPGSYVFVKRGTLYAGTGWVQIVSDPSTFTVGTDSNLVTQFSDAGTYTAGTGLTLTGTEFSVNAAQTQITSLGTLTGLTVSGTTSLPSATSIGDVSSTELGYLDGVTSAIQTQINAKANTSSLATVATSGSYDDLTNKPSAGVTTGKAIAMAIVFGG